MGNLKALILAAGEGTRMKSDKAKVLHEAAGRTLLGHVIRNAEDAGADAVAVVVGHQGEKVEASLPEDVSVFYQKEQLGTGHAVMQAAEFFKDPDDDILVLCGDAPLTRPETIAAFEEAHRKSGSDVTVMSAVFDDPSGYGRIIRSGGEFLKIVEHKDASPEERKVREINSGIYLFKAKALQDALSKITTENAQNEYYLTDAVEIIRDSGGKADAWSTDDPEDIAAVNSKVQLAQAAAILRRRINTKLMESGVIMIDPNTVYIDADVQIGRDTVVWPGAILEGGTVVGEDCVIGQNCHLVNAVIADGVDIQSSTILDSSVGSGTHVGPYAYIRPGSTIGRNAKVGDFVEVKNSVVKDGAKASHLTYIGDAEVGRNVNLGCGTVFVNYDGRDKFKTVVGDDCFIGCNSNLVAPVQVGDGAYVAAGSTITKDVPGDALAIARARQTNKEEYAKKLPAAQKKAGR